MNKKVFNIIVLIFTLSIILTLSSKKELKNVEEIKVKEESNNIIGIYIKQEDNTYKQSNTIPDNYTIISNESYCIVGDNKDVKTYDMFSYDISSKTLSVSNLTSKDTKCYLYFEEYKTPSQEMLAKLKIQPKGTIDKFTGTACDANTNNSTHSSSSCTTTDSGVYSATTSDGTTYYYRGTVNNNWVKFGNYWWRIIRINENGTVRMIYSGTNSTGTQPDKNDGRWVQKNNSQTGTSAYNTYYGNNAYVGFKYGDLNPSGNNDTEKYNNAHKNTTDSTILTALKTWYTSAVMDKSLIDGETGFCNDREKSIVKHGNDSFNNLGYGTNATWYAPFDRVAKSDSSSSYASVGEEQKPTFECKNKTRDLFTTSGSDTGNGALDVPVGLITSDEVIYAGGFAGQNNYGYWLYTGNYYWTMSPRHFDGSDANVFAVYTSGNLSYVIVSGARGVRPVINLKATTNFSGSGTIGDPYIPS